MLSLTLLKCFALSSQCSKNWDAILVCSAVLLIPVALAKIGSAVGELLSLIILLGGTELLTRPQPLEPLQIKWIDTLDM